MSNPQALENMAGEWVLDSKASESLDGILSLKGVGWLKRKAAAAFSQTQQITVGPQGLLSIVTTTGPVSTVVKGQLAQEEGDNSEAKSGSDEDSEASADVQLVECTDDECESLMIRVVLPTKDDGQMVVTHALKKDDVNVKITRMSFQRKDGKTATALRVFHRK